MGDNALVMGAECACLPRCAGGRHRAGALPAVVSLVLRVPRNLVDRLHALAGRAIGLSAHDVAAGLLSEAVERAAIDLAAQKKDDQ
jgi:hypothetical protein